MSSLPGQTDQKTFFWMLEDDILRLKGYSQRNSREGKANALYTADNGSIDRGFLEAKTIKHSFDAFPKIRIGQFSQFSDEIQPIDYGLNEPIKPQELPQTNFQPDPIQEHTIVEDNDDIF